MSDPAGGEPAVAQSLAAQSLAAQSSVAEDAVRGQLDDEMAPLGPLVVSHGLFVVDSRALSPQAYLRRPDLGRSLDSEAVQAIRAHGTPGATVQIVIGDGLAAHAVGSYAPAFVSSFAAIVAARGWSLGRVIAVRHAQVGLMNEIGELLLPEVVLFLIGERPGQGIQASLSAYFGYRPDKSHTDADRSLISNIHDSGLLPARAASDAAELVGRLLSGREAKPQDRKKVLMIMSFA
jgi:ethanolamine ammonia-lyase small subunit